MRIPLQAKLTSTLADLHAVLSNHPGLKMVSDGTAAKYAISSDGNLYIFTFGRNAIVEEICSAASPVYLMREALLEMLGIAAFVGECYDVCIESIFPYIVSELAGRELHNVVHNSAKPNGRDASTVLAKRINLLISEIASLKQALDVSEETIRSMCARLLIIDSQDKPIKIDALAKKYRVSDAMIRSASKLLLGRGYRAIEQHGSLRVVRQ